MKAQYSNMKHKRKYLKCMNTWTPTDQNSRSQTFLVHCRDVKRNFGLDFLLKSENFSFLLTCHTAYGPRHDELVGNTWIDGLLMNAFRRWEMFSCIMSSCQPGKKILVVHKECKKNLKLTFHTSNSYFSSVKESLLGSSWESPTA